MLRSIFTNLSTRRSTNSPAKRSTFSPRLEALEDRLVPAITFHADAQSVTVDGDYWGNDTLVVRAMADGSHTVTDTAGTTITAPAGKSLRVYTHNGDDVVLYRAGDLNGVTSAVFIDLGQGNNNFSAAFGGDLRNGANVFLAVQAWEGADVMNVYGTEFAPNRNGDHVADGSTINTGGLLIDSTSHLNVAMFGGGGADIMHFAYDGELDGHLGLEMSGDAGDDFVGASLTVRERSTGQIGNFEDGRSGSALVEGGAGSDTLAFHIDDHSDHHVAIDAAIDGDYILHLMLNKSPFDKDTASHTSNVAVMECEVVTLQTY
ncbi:MAG: hypothetical protein U0793_00870 [Gemmataceae bacterium]